MNKNNSMNSFASASRHAFYFLAALASILLVFLNLPFQTRIDPNYFYPSHTVLESIGILMAAMIFVIGWAQIEGSRTLRFTILTSAFLGLGIMDMAHVLILDGTFAASLENARATSAKMMLTAQAFAALALLSFAYCPVRNISKREANIIVCGFALISAALITYLIRSTDASSAILDSNMGATTIKMGFEICIGALYSIAGLKIYRHSKLAKDYQSLTIATATVILAMSVILLSNYYYVNELASLLGHAYKLAAYILLFQTLVIKKIEQPYFDIRALERRFKSTLEAMPDMVFETSLEGDFCAFYSDPGREDLLVKPEKFIGHNLREYMSVDAANTCLAALQEADEKGQSYGRQYDFFQADGEYRYEISVSSLMSSNHEKRFVLLVRDVSARYALAQRLEALLSLSKASDGLAEHAVAQLGLDTLEKLTNSKVSFLHSLSEDERTIELLAWGSDTETRYCAAEQEPHSPPESAGIWADCIKTRTSVVINDYPNEPSKNRLPEGHSELKRFVSVPIFDGERIAMIIGIGNSDYPYNASTVHTIELFGMELHQMLQRRRAQNEAEKNRLLLTSALENLPVGVAITTRGKDPKFEYFNQKFPALYGVSPSNLENFGSFWDSAIEDRNLRHQMLEKMLEDFASGDPNRLRWERVPVKGDGKTQHYLNVQTVKVANTNLDVTLAEDVTEVMKREEETRIAATAFSSQEGILITDANLGILRANAAFERDSGYTAQELIGKTPAFLKSGLQDAEFYKQMWAQLNKSEVWRGEIVNKSKDGKLAPFSLTISAVKNTLGTVTHFVADYVSLSDIKTAQETITRLSYFDTLTGLPNREHLKSILSADELKAHSISGYIGALMIDLDGFKTINETLGHACGDLLLLEVAKRLKMLLRSDDQAARYGGDEFVILLMNLGENEEQASLKTQLLAQSFVYSLEDTYLIEDNSYFSTASIGVTLLKADNPNSQEVFKQLDIALSSAKNDGNNQIRFFDPSWQKSVNKQASLLNELRIAIREKQLELFYQPQLNEHGEIVGAEGLIRWNHPTSGLLPPSEFLPIAQENNLMIKIGDEVLRMGLEQLHQWQQGAFAHIKLSLNITADQFYEERFEKDLLALLNEFSIIPGSLMLEFTESMILGEVDEAREKIIRLNDADIEFAIDDFGTGYSSLSYLSTLPMDQLKIDQSFVRNIGVVETDTQIVKAIINMAKILKLGVIAEGVETQAQFDYLKTQNCELFQGYLFSKPVSIAEFNQFVRNATP